VVTSFGTPETATAALGTAHGVRVRRAEEWAAGRKRKNEEGNGKGRRRGRGAQLRRQVKKRQATMDEWRRQQTAVQPGSTRAESQRHGCTRLLTQLTKVKMELATADRQKMAVEAKMGVVQTEVEVLQKWYDGQEAMDLRRIQHLLHLEKMKVKSERRERDEAVAEMRSVWAVNVSNGELHEADRKKWEAEKLALQGKLREAEVIAEQEAELYGGGAVSREAVGTEAASPGTTRKVDTRPQAKVGLPPRKLRLEEEAEMVDVIIPDATRAKDGTLMIRFEWDGRVIAAIAAASQKAGTKLRVAVPRKQLECEAKAKTETEEQLERIWNERDAIEDQLWAAQDELGDMQLFMSQDYPGSHAAWIARCGKKQKKKKSSSSVAG